MIEFSRDQQNTIPSSSVKIVGLGGAGANMLDRVVLDGMEGAEVLALNTDIRTLSGSVAKERIQLGRNLTKGLGAGGDPELGQQAILEAEAEVRAALRGRKIVFLCVGLGGGTGSGAAPIVCRIAREEGAFVVVFATMPFAFEGRRRREQADTSLNELAVLSHALVTFDNNRMGELVLAKQGIHEAFSAGDRMIAESIKAVIRLVVRPGLIHVGLDELMTALRTTRSRCLFGSGLASGKDRAAKALRNALSSPLLDQGSLLKDAETVLVHLCGGEDLTLFEIELLMQNLSKYVPEKAHVLFGAAVDPAMGDSLSITMVSALPEDRLNARREPVVEKPALLEPSDGFVASPAPVDPVREPEATRSGEEEIAKASDFFSDDGPEEPEADGTEEAQPTAAEAVGLDLSDFAPFAESPSDETPASADQGAEEEEPVEDPEEEDSPFTFAEPESAFVPVVDEEESEPDPVAEKRSAEVEDFAAVEDLPAFEEAARPVKTKPKSASPQGELSFDGGPRGRFEGASPSLFEGEDLDVPAFLRKKR